MQTSSKFVGIDLGTSTSALAYVREDGEPEIVPNIDGERLTPSVVFFDQFEGVKLVGSSARAQGDSARMVQHIKRHMDEPDYFVEIDGEKWTPTEISSLMAKLKQDCSQQIGEIKDVVITVPANFNELARRATVTAGQLAGLNVFRIVNEPTAAALYYAHAKSISGRVMVYDLGGGTLDITILEVAGENVDILLSEGARHLGGCDFDEILFDIFAREYKSQRGRDLKLSDEKKRRLLTLCEGIKKTLSKLNVVSEACGSEIEGIVKIQVTRAMFEEAIRKLITRTVMLVEQALDALGIKPHEIDHIVLVGGSTRVPIVGETLEKQFGKKPISCGNVDECVALGAALFAKKALNVTEVCNHSYGTLAVIEDAKTGLSTIQNSIVIPKNTPIPCSMSQVYIASQDSECLIEIEITQGDDRDPRYVDVIGKIALMVPANRPSSELTVTYSYDENQRVMAEIYDSFSGISHHVAIEYSGRGVLSDKEIIEKSAYIKQVKIA
jgi:molecular chaperone DnaK